MNILLTSVGRRSYLVNYFKDAVKAYSGKVFAANSVETFALKQADFYTLTPQIYSEEYVDFLINYCLNNEIKVIISLFDIDLPILALNKQKFKQHGIDVIISDFDVINICNDKWLSYQFLLDKGIPTPKTYIDLDSAKQAILKGDLQYPIIIKPRWGMGSIAIYKADNEQELDVFYKKVLREINSSYLRFESGADINKAILIQECIAGGEFGIEILNDLQGNHVATFCKEKVAMRSGETDIAVTVENSALNDIGKNISTHLKHTALVDVDCLEQGGKFYVLEINARFGGQYPFSHLAGVNVPNVLLSLYSNSTVNEKDISIIYNVVGCKDIQPVRLS
ncbi:ATP-grasp domain-containing protein [Pseudoalteromonas porphyrae]|uniref:ATP-grasp domain-containing protein n=1 Tax=Pseudoalteromonas porphyrae TaxID=187330 RepID=A0A0N1MWU8_9GAMM|nr:ATP-grasp domain-containing protein [Pseudoalteromonas porphyrae]KPH65143.1 hypothetical protein ADS77_02405 [Pseudoalteromonas porphyrae]